MHVTFLIVDTPMYSFQLSSLIYFSCMQYKFIIVEKSNFLLCLSITLYFSMCNPNSFQGHIFTCICRQCSMQGVQVNCYFLFSAYNLDVSGCSEIILESFQLFEAGIKSIDSDGMHITILCMHVTQHLAIYKRNQARQKNSKIRYVKFHILQTIPEVFK